MPAAHDLDVPVPLATAVAGLHAAVWPPKVAAGASWMIGVHNLTANLCYWGPVASALAGEVGFAAFDLRGRAGSWGLAASSGMGAHVADVLAVADAVGAGRFAVVGHRYGEAVATGVARAAPERVTECITLDGITCEVVAAHRADLSNLAGLLDPTIDRLASAFPNRDAYLAYWRSQPWFTAAGVDRTVRHALMADLVGSGFGWQVRVSRSAVDHDVAELAASGIGLVATQLDANVTRVALPAPECAAASIGPGATCPLPRYWLGSRRQ